MRIVVQKVLSANVEVDQKLVSSIDKGLLLLVAFKKDDTLDKIPSMAKKVANLRIFEDENDVMNKSALDVNGKVLSVSQFTLYGDVTSGNRPSYINSMNHEQAKTFYDEFNKELSKYLKVETGIFRADMKVSLTNDGPTTIILEK